MDVSAEREDAVSASKVTLSEQHDSQTRDKSPVKQKRPPDKDVPSCVSMSGWSIQEPIEFQGGDPIDNQIQVKQERPDSPGPNCLSIKSDRSMSEPIEFKNEPIVETRAHRKRSEVLSNRPVQKHRQNLDSIFMVLEENIVTFVKNELKKYKNVLESSECLERLNEDDEVMEGEKEEQRSSNRDAFMTLTLNFLRNMKQEQLADSLLSKTLAAICQRKLKSKMKNTVQCLFEGMARAGNPKLLNRIYMELQIKEDESGEANEQPEFRQIEAPSQNPKQQSGSETTIRSEDIFKPILGRDKPVRTLVTKGVAGIGKTVLTQKYILDWAEDKSNHSIQFIFPFTFRELNLLKAKKFSLVELLHHIFTETKEAGICRFENFQVVFIFDGLDECRLPLDFHTSEIVTDVTESTSVEVLLTNLIRGKLLPSARLWITTRPAAACQIPPEYVDMVTEVGGFRDPQKEEYFRRRYSDEEQAKKIISHIEASRSLHIMCRIPVFCWITSTVLDHVLKTTEREELPKTLTEMYIHFLLVLTKQGNVKYHRSAATDPVWNSETKKTILTLGKLAFEHLEKGNLTFYEADLKECGIDITAASVYSGLFTEIHKDVHGLNEEKVFCFVHLSVQEFLAALYVYLTFNNTGVDKLRKKIKGHSNFKHLFQSAVDKAIASPNGHLDLFVRFLLGLSLEINRTLLRGLLKTTSRKQEVKEMLVQYIQKKIGDNPSPEKSINLFHCLNELNDHSLEKEIQQYLRSGSSFGNKLSHSQWSALVFILLSSQKDLDVFDLRKFSASEEGFLKLLPVVKASKTAILSGCNLTSKIDTALASVLTSKNSLRELDLSNNDLRDTGLKGLSYGLRSPHCKLESLCLSGCRVTEKGCADLVSALKSNPSHLRELDMSFNHPGDSGLKLLRDGLDDPQWKLETLKTDHCGKNRLNSSPLKYFCELSLDPNTAHRNLSVSDDNRQVMVVKEMQPYPDHPERFDSWKQLLCREGLYGRCYWEVHFKGMVHVGVTYRDVNRRGDGDVCCFGLNNQSWSLLCTAEGYTAWHNNTETVIATLPPSDSNRVAVYLDWAAGTVSFYCLPSIVSSVKQIHLHTFQTTFTKPLYPAFGFGRMLELGTDSICLPSVYLSQFEE
ncbi:protein NLRC3-like [Etheostoma cragini]|uniref:protein NLRC3-like n=1 Tax=Etheostoma cragini TaxID=417921 RepID=UPI00155E7589|nr:protein NLRC3-like [Etheostoma cragini]XP_034713685.1 protein NLRC3-like [Etheostoma cragini]